MKMRYLLVLSMLMLFAACTDDTVGIAGINNDTGIVIDTGNNSMPDMSMPDMSMPPALGGIGDACQFGADCESGICINGVCAEGCGSDADCEDGFSCDELVVGLENGGTETVRACVRDVPCTANSDCSDPDVCVVDRSGATIDLTCDDPVGGGDVGDACTGDADCASGLCLDDACSAPCDTSNDCAADGAFVCEIQSVPTDGGGDADLTVCVPREADVCLSDGDCSGTDRCVANKSMTELEFTCGDAVGAGESGDACAADADCAQNLCLGDVCAGPCEVVGDCGGEPQRCVVTNVDLGGGAMDSAQICRLPISCGSQGDCPVATGDVCYVREAAGTLDPICRAANPAGGGLGQVCNGDSQCANNFCLETRFRDVCVVPCVNDADCGVAGYECGTVTVDLSTGGTQDLDVCVPEAPPACTAESDCGSGRDCAIIENAAGDGLESVCVPATGGDTTGVACVDDEDCGSLVCLNSFCASPCTDDIQCTGGQLCLDQTITKGANSGAFDVCTTLPDTQCTSTDDCTDGTRVCGEIRTNIGTATQEGYCTFPNAGGAQLGETCAQDNDCRDNICLTGLASECSVICDKDSDCAANGECTTYGDSLNFCSTACSDNSDCGAPNRYCTINGDVLADEIDQVCVDPIGTQEIGATCVDGSECLTGICLNSYLFDGTPCSDDTQCNATQTCECPIGDPNCVVGKECATKTNRCTNLCDDNSDCTGPVGNALTDCSTDIFVQTPSGGSQMVAACSEP